MASKSNVHAARTSPIPGLVVIVLAVAAIFFGLAVVQRPPSRDELPHAELARIKAELARTSEATQAELEALRMRTAALEQALREDAPRRR